MAPVDGSLRWSLAGTERQGSLLDDDVDPTRELREVEYLHVRARRSSARCRGRRACRSATRSTRTAAVQPRLHVLLARPTHEYLGLNGLEDFERRIVVKINAVQRLSAELARPSWSGEHIGDGHEHRSLPAGRGPLPAHARHPPDARRRAQSVLGADEVDDDPARSRRVPGGRRAYRGAGKSLHRHARRRRLAHERAGHAAASATSRGCRAPERGGGPVRRPDRTLLPGISDGDEQLADVVRACVEAGAVSIDEHRTAPAVPACASSSCPGSSATGPTSSSATARSTAPAAATSRARSRSASRSACGRCVQRFGGCANSPRESRLAPVPEPRRQAPAPPHEQLPLVG